MLTGDEADESTLARTDLVVATPDVDITALAFGDVPVIQLGQVFDPAELISRMSRLNLRGHVDLQLTGANSSLLMSMLSPDRFMAMPAGTDYWSATEALVAYLVDQGLVDETFLTTLRARENEAAMLLDGLVGFPTPPSQGPNASCWRWRPFRAAQSSPVLASSSLWVFPTKPTTTTPSSSPSTTRSFA